MENTARLFNCARCRRQVAICSHCDRGNIYCGPNCSQQARRESMKAAGGRYQRSRRGRFAHAKRQHRHRMRRNKVTHQGSPPPPPDGPLSRTSKASARHGESCSAPATDGIHCHLCGRLCSAFIRLEFLRGRHHRRPDRKPTARCAPVRFGGQGP